MTLRWCNFSGVAFLVMWLVGFVFFAQVVPPPSPQESAIQVAGFFGEHAGGIRFGLLLTLFVSPLYASWSAAIAAQMKRMSGVHPVLADLQLVLGGLTVLVFMIPALLLEVAAFRPDRAPGTIQTLDDIAWMMFIGMGATAILQPAIIAVAIFQDRGVVPVLPRWVGYLNLWTVLLFLPGPLCVFFKTGPLAWDGIFTWWIPFVVFALWMLVMIAVVHRSISRCEHPPIASAAVDAEIGQQITQLVDAKIDALRLELTQKDLSR
jgi:membrane protein implicated in regulation of membrane protease activity